MFSSRTAMRVKYYESLTIEIDDYGMVRTYAPEGFYRELLVENPFSVIREFEEGLRLDGGHHG